MLGNALARAFETPFEIGDYTIHLSARIGIAQTDDGSDAGADAAGGAASLVRRASAALALARGGEAGTIEVFRTDPAGDPLTRLANLESDLHRAILTVEVTEGAFINDIHGAVALLAALRGHGIVVAIDDFGTGYSSLAWLARLPIDVIKLDRSFTLGLTGTPRERVVVETMVRLSKQLGLTVIAEGVEDDIQLEATRLAGCDGVQGYRVAAPISETALEAFCASWQERRLHD
jgi:predicted signal transduction protein with EAL and GGDEF domain